MSESQELEFIELIKNHEGIIHKVIGLYIDNDEDRKDLNQEILLQAWKSYKNFKGKSAFSTWLYKVSLNTVLSFNKKSQAKTTDELNGEIGIKSEITQREDHEMLYYIVRSLGEVDRMLITLHFDGFKNPEIAEITGMTTNNINVKIHRLKAKIITRLKTYAS